MRRILKDNEDEFTEPFNRTEENKDSNLVDAYLLSHIIVECRKFLEAMHEYTGDNSFQPTFWKELRDARNEIGAHYSLTSNFDTVKKHYVFVQSVGGLDTLIQETVKSARRFLDSLREEK